jgi:tRNA(Ile)-lysidine synthase
MGYLLSSAQRDEIQRVDELVISDRFVIAKDQHFIYIAPKCEIVMSKEFKERCRLLQIPKKIRAYLFQEKIDLGYFSSKSD